MAKIRVNPNKMAWEAHVAARAQAIADAQAEQAASERRPWFVRGAMLSQALMRLPFAIVFNHGELIERIWRATGRVRRAWRILRSGQAASRITDARWAMCNRCPYRFESEQGSFCRQCGCGDALVGQSAVLRLMARIPVLRALPRWLIRVGRLEHQNTLTEWDCSLGFFREMDHG